MGSTARCCSGHGRGRDEGLREATRGRRRLLPGFRREGKRLRLQVGFSHPVFVDIPPGLNVECPSPTHVVIKAATSRWSASSRPARACPPPGALQGQGCPFRWRAGRPEGRQVVRWRGEVGHESASTTSRSGGESRVPHVRRACPRDRGASADHGAPHSTLHIYVQMIDDDERPHGLRGFSQQLEARPTAETSTPRRRLARSLGRKAKEVNVDRAGFDRGALPLPRPGQGARRRASARPGLKF